MTKLFSRADTSTAKKTLRMFKEEIIKDKSTFYTYTILIPINRLLYIVVLPLLFSLIIQALITHPTNWRIPLLLVIIATVVSILSLLTSYFSFRRLFDHQERVQTSLLKRAIEGLSAHSDQFFASRKTGSLTGDVTKFAHSFIDLTSIVYLQLVGIFVNFTASLLIIAVLSPILLVPLATITGLLIWRSIVGTKRRSPLRAKRQKLSSLLNGTIADIVSNQQAVRFFAAEKRELSHVTKDRQDIEVIAQKEISVIEKENIIRQAALFAFQIITMLVATVLYINQLISIAALIFAVTYLSRLTASLFDISPIIRGIEQAFLDSADVTDILDTPIDVIDDPSAMTLTVTKGSVEFKNVDFAYTDAASEKVISNLSFVLPPGQRVGLVGFSGGGKTTMTKLMLRFADVTAGTITIDDQDISKVSQQSLRKNIAYVPQEAYLFHRSLRDNVAYARPEATDDEIWSAIEQANAIEFVRKLAKGIDTTVGERGVKLSGGQRQRIAIARAILKDAPILILDEATSALDSESEKLIQNAFEKLMKDRTSIVIAHRLSTITKLDRIIVLDDGSIAEDGTHQELLSRGGIYAKLWQHQSGGFVEE